MVQVRARSVFGETSFNLVRTRVKFFTQLRPPIETLFQSLRSNDDDTSQVFRIHLNLCFITC